MKYHLFGANSHLAREFIQRATEASNNNFFYLYSRSKPRDFDGENMVWVEFDATKFDSGMFQSNFDGEPSVALIFHANYENVGLKPDNIKSILDIYQENLISHQIIIDNLLEIMSPTSKILVLGSIASQYPSDQELLYGPAKAALSIFVSAISRKAKKCGVSITEVISGAFQSPQTKTRPTYENLMKVEDVAKILMLISQLNNLDSLNIDKIFLSKSKA
ncbi:MAG: hypothetical protein RLZ10_1160 [Bacteroidota bacterium]